MLNWWRFIIQVYEVFIAWERFCLFGFFKIINGGKNWFKYWEIIINYFLILDVNSLKILKFVFLFFAYESSFEYSYLIEV